MPPTQKTSARLSFNSQTNKMSAAGQELAAVNSPTFTGTVGGVTQAMVGLGNVNNTSDVNKPVSTATQTELNDKANKTDLSSS
jgi:hypothetical protein